LDGEAAGADKEWYDTPGIRNIKLGTIAAILMAIGALIKGYWNPEPTPAPNPDEPAVVAPDEPQQPDAASVAEGWQRTNTLTTKANPVFGVPSVAPGCKREWRVVQGDKYWYFRDVPE
jgi:hypothetical protein